MHDHKITHLSEYDRRKFLQIAGLATGIGLLSSLAETPASAALPAAKLPGFSAFAKSVKVFKGDKYYLVESDGIPAHQMMVGIKSWQQQVPTSQPYSGSNAWSIPITPVIATNPISAKGHFLRGAIAIAVNGVPIFNALNNRGDDALLAGELDNWEVTVDVQMTITITLPLLTFKALSGQKHLSHTRLMVFLYMARKNLTGKRL